MKLVSLESLLIHLLDDAQISIFSKADIMSLLLYWVTLLVTIYDNNNGQTDYEQFGCTDRKLQNIEHIICWIHSNTHKQTWHFTKCCQLVYFMRSDIHFPSWSRWYTSKVTLRHFMRFNSSSSHSCSCYLWNAYNEVLG